MNACALFLAASLSMPAQAPLDLTMQEAAERALAAGHTLAALEERILEEDGQGTLGMLLRNPEFRIGRVGSERVLPPVTQGQGFDRILEDTEFAFRFPGPKLSAFGFDQAVRDNEVEGHKWRLQAAREGLVYRVMLLHSRLRILAEKISLAGEQVQLAERIADLLQRRLEASAATGLDASLSSIEVHEAKTELSQAQGAYDQQMIELRYFLQLPDDAQVNLVAPKEPICKDLTTGLEELKEAAVGASPALKVLRSEKRAADARHRRTYLGLVPWFDFLQAGVTPASSQEPWRVDFRISFRLPILNWAQNDRARFSSQSKQSEAVLIDEELKLNRSTLQAVARFEDHRRRLSMHEAADAAVLKPSEAQIEFALSEGAGDPVEMAVLKSRIFKAKDAHLRAKRRCEEAALQIRHLAGELGRAEKSKQN